MHAELELNGFSDELDLNVHFQNLVQNQVALYESVMLVERLAFDY